MITLLNVYRVSGMEEPSEQGRTKGFVQAREDSGFNDSDNNKKMCKDLEYVLKKSTD